MLRRSRCDGGNPGFLNGPGHHRQEWLAHLVQQSNQHRKEKPQPVARRECDWVAEFSMWPRSRSRCRAPIHDCHQDFVADGPKQGRVADTLEFVLKSSSKLTLAAVLDLCSRCSARRAVSAIHDRHLVIEALRMSRSGLVLPSSSSHHSDQGGPCASGHRAVLKTSGHQETRRDIVLNVTRVRQRAGCC